MGKAGGMGESGEGSFMKALIPAGLVGALALLAVSYKEATEQAPDGALEKIVAALPAEAFVKPDEVRRMLVFGRTNGYRHASIPTGKLALVELGARTGAYEAVVSEDPANFEKGVIEGFDAICFLNTTGNVFAPFSGELGKMSEGEKAEAKERELRLKENLMRFVRGGGGFVGIHAATDTFHEWPEYGEMMNGYFDGHPWTAKTDVSIRVEAGEEEHPMVRMFEGGSMDFKEEIYQFKAPYDSSKVHMLLRLDPGKSDMKVRNLRREDRDWGVAWARRWGGGRVFYCSIGHNHEMYWNSKILSHYLAGIQWALGDYKMKINGED